MKKLYFFLIILISFSSAHSQTWIGGTIGFETDWNTPTNWSTGVVPVAASNVIINNVANSPKLGSNVLINGFNATAGSIIDLNGFTITVNGDCDFIGSTLNNSSPSTDIVLNFNGGFINYFRNNTINDNITINQNNNANFYEGYIGGNVYNYNTTLNTSTNSSFNLCYSSQSNFKGNLTINKTTAAGTMNIFKVGMLGVAGNFNYTNNFGGATTIGDIIGGTFSTIDGTINVNSSPAANPKFFLYGMINKTNGGTINILNSGQTNLSENILKVANLNINGYNSGAVSDVYLNNITGNVTITENVANSGGSYLRGNTIAGNTIVNFNGTSGFYEAYQISNTFNGDFTANVAGTGLLSIGYDHVSTFNGNVTVNRTVAGITEIFKVGNVVVTGNLNYTNNAGGATTIGQSGGTLSTINGTINISCNSSNNPNFFLYKTINKTNGGTISILNSGQANLSENTLKVANFSVSYTSNSTSDVYFNSIIGNLTMTEGATNSGGSYLRGNTITGNTIVNFNGASGFYEAYQISNTFNGDFTVNAAGSGLISIGYDHMSTFNGNVTVNRTIAGITEIFKVGNVVVTGNLNYTNNSGGTTTIGQISGGTLSTINGTINLNSNFISGNPSYNISKVKNLTTGGNCTISNSGQFGITGSDLIFSSFSVNNFNGGFTDLFNNVLTGFFSMTESASNSTPTYLRGNTIDGNFTYTQNANTLYEAYQAANNYLGNATFTINAGTIILAYNQQTNFYKSLIVNSNAGISFVQPIHFMGSSNGIIDQLGTQQILIPRLLMEKTGNSFITLNDKLQVSVSATFTTGNIISATGKALEILDNGIVSGFSNSSFVDGPVIKVGDDPFTFPIGKINKIAPISISAPAQLLDAFTAEYNHQNPHPLYNNTLKDGILDHISPNEYWVLNRTAGTSNVFVTMSWENVRSGSISSLASLKVARWNGGSWKDEGNSATTGDITSGTIKSGATVINFSPFTLASADAENSFSTNPLPLSLISFSGKKENEINRLKFITSNEIKVKYFEIERSLGVKLFEKIGTINAIGGMAKTEYNFIDESPIKASNYYRLKMVDNDGVFKYSPIISIVNAEKIEIKAYPNPSNDYITVNRNTEISAIQIADIAGKIVKLFDFQSNNKYIISGLAKGLYFVRIISNNNNQAISKLIVE